MVCDASQNRCPGRASVRRHGMHAKMCGSNCDHADCGRLVGHTQNAVPDVLFLFLSKEFSGKKNILVHFFVRDFSKVFARRGQRYYNGL